MLLNALCQLNCESDKAANSKTLILTALHAVSFINTKILMHVRVNYIDDKMLYAEQQSQ